MIFYEQTNQYDTTRIKIATKRDEVNEQAVIAAANIRNPQISIMQTLPDGTLAVEVTECMDDDCWEYHQIIIVYAPNGAWFDGETFYTEAQDVVELQADALCATAWRTFDNLSRSLAARPMLDFNPDDEYDDDEETYLGVSTFSMLREKLRLD